MNFASFDFFIFLFLCLAIFQMPFLRSIRLYLLILASIVFMAASGLRDLALILSSVCVNYAMMRWYAVSRTSSIWIGAIVFNVGLIGVFKYTGFFEETLSLITGNPVSGTMMILPIAISFYTFQQIVMWVDLKRGDVAQVPSFSRYAFFVLFFPQLIAGPIVKLNHILPQLEKDALSKFLKSNVVTGFAIMAIGLFKKVILADSIGVLADQGFAQALEGPVPAGVAWGSTLAFSLQIYFDFSGYSDIAVGAAKLFGIHLPLNFFSPYKAANIIEFWRRWHITLSDFLRHYVYLPLGGGPDRSRRFTNLMVTMLIGGLWHGPSWNFVIWGGFHGLALAGFHYIKEPIPRIIPNDRLRNVLGVGMTFLFVSLLWIPFRSESLTGTLNMVQSLVGFESWGLAWSPEAAILLLGLALVFAAPNTVSLFYHEQVFLNQDRFISAGHPSYPKILSDRVLIPATGVLLFCVYSVIVWRLSSSLEIQSFIYFRF